MGEPHVFTIPTGIPFLPTLADALLDGSLTRGRRSGTGLADATIYVPTRRAARALAALLAERAGAPALLLPRIVPLGDADGDPFEPDGDGAADPPLSPLERRLTLARLVQAWAARPDLLGAAGSPIDRPGSPSDAVALAGDLAALMDSLATEDVPWDALAQAVESEFSHYFALTLEFVRIAHESWPRILAERGASDPSRNRYDALEAEAERLRAAPPDAPVIAAGSTGSMPTTARLLSAISRLPHGAVVLPGLDTDLDAASWDAIVPKPARGIAGAEGREPIWGHPQFMLRRLLADHLGIGRDDVRVLGPSFHPHAPQAARRRVLSEVMRPAETTDAWAAIPPIERIPIAEAGTDGVALVEAADEREEALAIAVALRETLAEPGRTAALVTPDRALARRVATELARWGVTVEDSAGVPLSDTAAGRLARLAAEAAASRFGAVPVLALLAHPGVRLGWPRDRVEAAAAALEIGALRGPAPGPDLAGLQAALALRRSKRTVRDPLPRQNLTDADWGLAADLLGRLEDAFAGFCAPDGDAPGSLVALARSHAETVAALTRPGDAEERGPAEGDEDPDLHGETALLALFDELALLGDGAALAGRFGDYPAFFATLARDRVVPPAPAGTHRRVKILGLLEARLLDVDRIVLGGLDEGIWPPTADSDAFLNRPMRLRLGLSPPERRIGQTAHDFVQALGTHDAILTHARKRGGRPTVPSRFLERLRSFTGARGWDRLRARGRRYLSLAAALDAGRPAAPISRPSPAPGAHRFPRSLSVTEVETLVRDPYAIYARHILRLTPLDPIGLPPSFSERGTILHKILSDFAGAHPAALPPTAEAELLQRGLDAFGPVASAYPELYALWWPDFQRIVPPYLDWEAERRTSYPERHLESRGRLEIGMGPETFTVRGTADRIELASDGRAAIVDYKSGRVPSDAEVGVGFSPQLTLEAAMLGAGGFAGVATPDGLPALLYVKLGGRLRFDPHQLAPPRRDRRSMAEIVEAHLIGIETLVRRYGIEGEGYLSRPFPQYANRFSAYDHLARVREWSAASAEEAGA